MVSEPAALGWVVRLEMLCGADHITWGRTHAGNRNVMVTYFLRTTCRKFDGDNFLRTSYFIIPGIPGTLYLELRSRLRTCWYDTRTLLLAYTTYCVAAAQGTAAVYEKLFHYSYVQAYTCACAEERTYIFFHFVHIYCCGIWLQVVVRNCSAAAVAAAVAVSAYSYVSIKMICVYSYSSIGII